MYIPIVCPSCGMVIGAFVEELRAELDAAVAEASKNLEFSGAHGNNDLKSFNYIFLKYDITPEMWCCRNICMSYVKYNQHMLPPPMETH